MWLFSNDLCNLKTNDCNSDLTAGTFSPQAYEFVLPAQLTIFESLHSQNKSIKSILNNNGPRTEPWGTPYSMLLVY